MRRIQVSVLGNWRRFQIVAQLCNHLLRLYWYIITGLSQHLMLVVFGSTTSLWFTKSSMSTNSLQIKEKKNEKSGWTSTGFNLANVRLSHWMLTTFHPLFMSFLFQMILGAGALAMPEAFSKGGIISGFVVLLLMCICGHFTSVLLVKCAIKVGVDSYEAV